MGCLGDCTARVLLRLQIWLLHWFHFLLLGFGLNFKHKKNDAMIKKCNHRNSEEKQVFIGKKISMCHLHVEIRCCLYLIIFGSFGEVKGGVNFSGALLAEGRHLKGDRFRQAVTRLQLQLGRLSWDLVEVSEELRFKF